MKDLEKAEQIIELINLINKLEIIKGYINEKKDGSYFQLLLSLEGFKGETNNLIIKKISDLTNFNITYKQ